MLAGDIVLNIDSHELTIANQVVHIGQTEFSILKFFIEHQNRVYSLSHLLDFIWGQSVYIEERTVDVHVLRLRKILKPFAKDKLIKTVRGAGYMFSLEQLKEVSPEDE